jgi:hypothetical protein
MPDLGQKHQCKKCGSLFYDLGKPEPACPKCGVRLSTEQLAPGAALRSDRRRGKAPVEAVDAVDEVEESPDELVVDLDEALIDDEPDDIDDEEDA